MQVSIGKRGMRVPPPARGGCFPFDGGGDNRHGPGPVSAAELGGEAMSVTLRGLVLAAVLTAGLALGRCTAPSGGLAARPSAAPSAAARPSPRCWETTVYLPLADNRGQSFEETTWQEALERLVTPSAAPRSARPRRATGSTPANGSAASGFARWWS